MSNTRKARWTTAEVTAANAEAELATLAQCVAGEDPATRSLLLALWDELDADGRAAEFPALAEQTRADTALKVAGGRFVEELRAQGAGPGVIALAQRRLAGLGTDYWAGIYRQAKGMARAQAVSEGN